MRNSIVKKIVDWGKKYQWCASVETTSLSSLYSKLIDEEIDELNTAFATWNIEEIYDAVGDIAWVCILQAYYSGMVEEKELDKGNKSFEYWISRAYKTLSFIEDLVGTQTLEGILEVIYSSNATKSLALQSDGEKKGKVIKGENYVPPKIAQFIEGLQRR